MLETGSLGSLAPAPEHGAELSAGQGAELSAGHGAGQSAERRPVDVVRGAGFPRHFVPARWGGAESTFSALVPAVVAIGESCPEAAVLASTSAYAGRLGAYLPAEGQRELWAAGSDRLLAATQTATGTLQEVAGGWRVTGEWRQVYGARLADWVLVCGPSPADARLEPRYLALPRGCYDVDGTDTVRADRVFVPARRCVPRRLVLTGRNEHSTARCHNVPFAAVAGLGHLVPALAGATAAVDACVAVLSGRRQPPGVALALTRAAGEIDAARLLAERIAKVLDAGTLSAAVVARNVRDAALAAELLGSAVNGLVLAGGVDVADGLADAHPLHRFWRDTAAARSNSSLSLEVASATFARSLLGAA